MCKRSSSVINQENIVLLTFTFLSQTFFHSVKLQGKSHLNLNSFDLSSNGSCKQLDTVKSCELYIETCLTFYSFLHLFSMLGYNHTIHRKYMINL